MICQGSWRSPVEPAGFARGSPRFSAVWRSRREEGEEGEGRGGKKREKGEEGEEVHRGEEEREVGHKVYKKYEGHLTAYSAVIGGAEKDRTYANIGTMLPESP